MVARLHIVSLIPLVQLENVTTCACTKCCTGGLPSITSQSHCQRCRRSLTPRSSSSSRPSRKNGKRAATGAPSPPLFASWPPRLTCNRSISDKEMAACLDVMQGTLQRDPSKRPVMKSLLQVQPPCSLPALILTYSPQHLYLGAGSWKGQFDESSLRAIIKWTMQVRSRSFPGDLSGGVSVVNCPADGARLPSHEGRRRRLAPHTGFCCILLVLSRVPVFVTCATGLVDERPLALNTSRQARRCCCCCCCCCWHIRSNSSLTARCRVPSSFSPVFIICGSSSTPSTNRAPPSPSSSYQQRRLVCRRPFSHEFHIRRHRRPSRSQASGQQGRASCRRCRGRRVRGERQRHRQHAR